MDRQQSPESAPHHAELQVLIRDHGTMIVQFCRAWLGEALGEEVAQEVFVTAWQKFPGDWYNWPQESRRQWLLVIARNKCKQAYRNWARRRAIVQVFGEEIRQRAHAEHPVPPGGDATQAAMRTRLHACLARLRATDRILLTLWYWKELPVADIMDILGKSEAAIRKQLSRAQQRLKELMHDTPDV